MTPTEEAITALEKALEAGPTPGEWKCQDESKFSPDEPYWIGAQHPDVGFVSHAVVRSGCSEADELGDMKANAAFIAACSPLAIRTLLDAHAGALRDAERYRWLRSKGIVLAGHDFISFDDTADFRIDRAMSALATNTKAQP